MTPPPRTSRVVAFLFCMSVLTANVRAHGMQYLLAKVIPGPGKVRLEITADYTGNPTIENEAQAQEAISGILKITVGGEETKVGPAHGMQFIKTAQLDPTCPMPVTAPPGEAPHEFLTGKVEIPVDSESITFSVPNGNPNDAVLWTVDENRNGTATPPQKFYLIAGDRTSPISVPPKNVYSWWIGLGCVIGGVVILSVMLRFRRRPAAVNS
jgi:hypothetical protein